MKITRPVLACLLALASLQVDARGHGGHGGFGHGGIGHAHGGFGHGHGGFGHGHAFHHGHGGGRFNVGFFYGPSFGYGYGYYPNYGYPYYPYYSYPSTVVTVPTQPPVYIERTPESASGNADGFWYYCSDPDGYYPYVRECHHAWRPVPARPQSKP